MHDTRGARTRLAGFVTPVTPDEKYSKIIPECFSRVACQGRLKKKGAKKGEPGGAAFSKSAKSTG
jgi:hypothetical protein